MSREATEERQLRPSRIPAERPGAPGGKRALNRQRRTRDLREAALGLFLEQGVEAVTIDAIARGAGMAKGSFYRYFQDKGGLVDALLAPTRDGVTHALDACGERLERATNRASLAAAYEALAEDLVAVFLRAPRVVRLYLQESRAPTKGAAGPFRALADAIFGRAVSLTEDAIHHGLLRDFDARISALTVVGAVERLTFEVLGGRDLGDLREIPRALVSLVLDGMRPDQPGQKG